MILGLSVKDVAIILITLSGFISGMRRGFLREFVVLCLWVPMLIGALMTALSQVGAGGLSQHGKMVLVTLGVVFALGMLIIWFIDRHVLKPAISSSFNTTMNNVNAVFGGAVGASRFVLSIIMVLVVYGIANQSIPQRWLADSEVLPVLIDYSKDLRGWLETNHFIAAKDKVIYQQQTTHPHNLQDVIKELPPAQRQLLAPLLEKSLNQ